MTEEVQGSQNAAVNEAVVNDTQQQQHNERMFSQSEVNELVKKVKTGAIADYQRLQETQPDYFKEKYGSREGSQSLSQDELRRIAEDAASKHVEKIRQEAYQHAQNERAQRVVQSFWNKTSLGKEKYSDFDTVTADVPLEIFPNVVQLIAEEIDNAEDVYYNLSQDLTKMMQLESLADRELRSGRTPSAAIKQLKRFANSLKDNEDAKHLKIPNEPLSQMRSSSTAAPSSDSRAMTVGDYRKKYKV